MATTERDDYAGAAMDRAAPGDPGSDIPGDLGNAPAELRDTSPAAVTVNLPTSIYILRRAVREHWWTAG
jgi:hypothetical protein